MTERPRTLTIRRPDDMHLHLRDGETLPHLVRATARQFGRAIVMPNLTPPVRTAVDAAAYQSRILEAAIQAGVVFEPLMTLYLTDSTTPGDIYDAASWVYGVKLYPQGATTNSDAGVSHIEAVYPALQTMQDIGLPLLIHGEATHAEFGEIDIFHREAYFIDHTLDDLVTQFPRLRIVLEHITTELAVDFVRSIADPKRVAATITAHHLLENRNALFRGGINPHNYCMPILKREGDRCALVDAATSGESGFFAGTDSAPHLRQAKERSGCAGCYTAPHALELYAEAFDRAGALEKLEGFVSVHGAQFYGLEPNQGTVTLVREAQTIPEDHYLGDPQAVFGTGGGFEDLTVVPFWAGRELSWRLADV